MTSARRPWQRHPPAEPCAVRVGVCLALASGWQLEQLPAMVAKVHSPDPAVQLEGTQEFRKLLSIGGC